MKTNLLSAALLSLYLVAVVGCATHEGAYAPQAVTKGNLESNTDFVLLDRGAQRSVTCSSLQSHLLADGRLEACANIRNRENRRIEVQVNCIFKNEQGFAVEEMPFSTLILTENATETVCFTANNEKAKKFTFRVRQAR